MAKPTVDVRPAASSSGRALGSSPSTGRCRSSTCRHAPIRRARRRLHRHAARRATSWRATKRQGAGGDARYSCQATELLNYTKPLKWWDARQYVDSYRSGNRTLPEIARGFLYLFYYYGTLAFSDRWGRPARWLYNRIQAITGGIPFPRLKGKIPVGQPTPRRDLGLRPGDLVRVKSYEEILATLDVRLSNRGLAFDAELVPFCGKIFRVSTCIERFVDEKTGQLRWMKTPAVILEGVSCKSLYSGQRMFCPRSIHLLVARNLARTRLH